MKPMKQLSYARVDTVLGEAFVAWNDRGVVCLDNGIPEPRFVARVAEIHGVPPVRAAVPASLKASINTALDGDTRKAPVDLSALPPFQQRVLKETMRIPAGQVRSYGAVADAIGAPRAARAVGTALARNPIPLLVPCHRVVRGDGSLGNYGLGGTPQKQMLLEREGFAAR